MGFGTNSTSVNSDSNVLQSQLYQSIVSEKKALNDFTEDWQRELYNVCMKDASASLPYYYNLIWLDQNICKNINQENIVYRKIFNDLGFSNFQTFEEIQELEQYLKSDVQDNILVIASGQLVRPLIQFVKTQKKLKYIVVFAGNKSKHVELIDGQIVMAVEDSFMQLLTKIEEIIKEIENKEEKEFYIDKYEDRFSDFSRKSLKYSQMIYDEDDEVVPQVAFGSQEEEVKVAPEEEEAKVAPKEEQAKIAPKEEESQNGPMFNSNYQPQLVSKYPPNYIPNLLLNERYNLQTILSTGNDFKIHNHFAIDQNLMFEPDQQELVDHLFGELLKAIYIEEEKFKEKDSLTAENLYHLNKTSKIRKNCKIIKKFLGEFYYNQYEIEDQKIDGWRLLPRMCVKVYSMNTFIYSLINEFQCGSGRNHLQPWHDILTHVFKICLYSGSYKCLDSNYVFHSSFVKISDVNFLLKNLAESSKQHFGMQGFITCSLNEKISRNYIETTFEPQGMCKVLFKIRLDKNGLQDTCISCFKLETLSQYPSEQEVVFINPRFIVNAYQKEGANLNVFYLQQITYQEQIDESLNYI